MRGVRQERAERLRARMGEAGLEGLVASAPGSIFYLSGFRGSSGALLITQDHAALLSDFRYRLQAKEQCSKEQAPGYEFVEVGGGAGGAGLAGRRLFAAAGALAKEWGVGRLGYEAGHLSCQRREELAEGAAGLELTGAPPMIEEMRATKSAAEVERMRGAAALADEALARMVELLVPGATEREVALEGEFLMRKAGAEAAAFDMIVASGPRSALPHAETTDRRLAPGDLVVVDMGARVEGYCSDMTRTFAVKRASRRAREVYALVYRAQRAGAGAVREGALCREVDAAARTVIAEAGYGEAFGHSLGHGVGIEVHEGPRLGGDEETRLAAGNVVTVEPGVYLAEMGGVRLEDMLAVTGDGAKTLTGSPMEAELPVV